MIDRHIAVVLFLLAFAIGPVQAQDYPVRAIRVVVGPGTDIVARVSGATRGQYRVRPIVVDPRSGAGGTIAAQTLAASAPDGYTLLLASASYTINTALQSSTFDLGRDFAPVGLVATVPFVLVVHPSV